MAADSTPPPSKLQVGSFLDRYELLHELAEGGMAKVWLARAHGKRGFKKLLVVKTIKAQFGEDQRFEEMFLDEGRIASGIQHPNVAQIIDLGEHEGTLFLAMEWVDGEPLARIRKDVAKKNATWPLAVALRVIADTCAGLHAAHELKDDDGVPLGVIHRDVSPQNIMIGTNGAVRVIDFGIAKARNRATGETSAGLIKGKFAYMSPEQAVGGDIDRRVDVWAAGVCLYELLSGRLPFDAEEPGDILKKIVSSRPPLPLPAQIPAAVREVVRTALSPLETRYANAEDFRRAIEGAMASVGLTCSMPEVAAFVEQHASARSKARQKTVAASLDAARMRAEAAGEPPSIQSAPGITSQPDAIALASEASQTNLGSVASAPTSRDSSIVKLLAAIVVLLIVAIGLVTFKTTRTAAVPAPPVAAPVVASAAPMVPSASPSASASAPASASAVEQLVEPALNASAAPPVAVPILKQKPQPAKSVAPKLNKPGTDDDF